MLREGGNVTRGSGSGWNMIREGGDGTGGNGTVRNETGGIGVIGEIGV